MSYISCLNGITGFDDSKQILEDKNLIVKEYDNLYIVKYDKTNCDMNDPDVRKCRGIVIEKNTNKLVCVPPPKSDNANIFNNVPLDKTIYEEFVEGTMISIFKHDSKLYMSTRSCINAYCNFYSNKTFNALFSEIIELDKFDVIDENMTLTFILQHPENTIVKKYIKPEIKLVYGCSINSDSIKHYDLDDLKTLLESKGLIFNIPEKYTITDVSQVYDILNKMDHTQQGIILKNIEFNYMRGKIRNEYYNYVRQLKGNSHNKKYLYLELKQNNSLEEYLKYFDEDTNIFEQYRIELFKTTTKLFNFYQDYHVRKTDEGKRVIQHFLDIDYEYRPLCNDLHNNYLSKKKPTDKKTVIDYVNSLPIAKLLFVMNYKYRKKSE